MVGCRAGASDAGLESGGDELELDLFLFEHA